MDRLAPHITCIDLEYLGTPRVIGSCLVEGANGPALIDPGPGSALETLRARLRGRGVEVKDLRAVLLTHIHLDHAGATGSLVLENPAIRVYVHERGATHLVDPTRLLQSAQRIYGAEMDRLWGEFLAVPAANITTLAGGERLEDRKSVV